MPEHTIYIYTMALFHRYMGSFIIMWKSQQRKRNGKSLDSILCEAVYETEIPKLTFT